MSDVVLLAVSLGVTVLGLLGSWRVHRRRGAASAMRGAAWSLVPMATYLTGLTAWAAALVFSPVKWAGSAFSGWPSSCI
jgi:cytochrome c oxidase assembly factor CtaG